MRVCKQGWPFVIGCFIVGSLFMGMGLILQNDWPAWVAGLAFLLALYCAYFFRDPVRSVPVNDRWILSPADGKVMEAVKGEDNGTPVWIVRIFLSIFDPHLQRAPLAGTIRAVRYKQGKFLDARDPQAHFENEQNRIEMTTAAGPVSVTQIAGLIARRIVCWIKAGDTLAGGQQFGLIRFGSQVDITFPVSAKLRVQTGERVKAGESVLAEL
jgi:phosphatidylserine decarboxylase